MSSLSIILGEAEVNAFLEKHDLGTGFSPVTHALLQLQGTTTLKPCAMLVGEVDGKPVLFKLTLAMLEMACAAMSGSVAYHDELVAKTLAGEQPS